MIYSLAPNERIDTGKTWPVYTVRLHAHGHRACVFKYSACNIKGTTWSQAIRYREILGEGGDEVTILNVSKAIEGLRTRVV